VTKRTPASALRTRARRLERDRPPIPHIERWIAEGGCAPKAFVFDQYGNRIEFKMSTVSGRERARVYLPPEHADDLLAQWEPEKPNDQKGSPWVLAAVALGIGAGVVAVLSEPWSVSKRIGLDAVKWKMR
jgi:hypothetical protein